MVEPCSEAREQVSVERLIELAWSDFEMRMLSIESTYVLWGSFSNSDELFKRYFNAKGEQHLLDRRKHLTLEEEERVEGIRWLAERTAAYRDWARQHGGEPILRDTLTSYCVAFESALKSVAVAFGLAKIPGGSAVRTYPPESQFKDAVKKVFVAWTQCTRERSDDSTAKAFYTRMIFEVNPDPARWSFRSPEDLTYAEHSISSRHHWEVVGEAFRLRNAVVHENGRLRQQVVVGAETFHAGDEVKLSVKAVQRISGAFRGLLDPINPEQFE